MKLFFLFVVLEDVGYEAGEDKEGRGAEEEEDDGVEDSDDPAKCARWEDARSGAAGWDGWGSVSAGMR